MSQSFYSIAQMVANKPSASEVIPSPCNSVCAIDSMTGFCKGCFRSMNEIVAWGQMDNSSKRDVWAALVTRSGGRQA